MPRPFELLTFYGSQVGEPLPHEFGDAERRFKLAGNPESNPVSPV
jgi:hypothetical protein